MSDVSYDDTYVNHSLRVCTQYDKWYGNLCEKRMFNEHSLLNRTNPKVYRNVLIGNGLVLNEKDKWILHLIFVDKMPVRGSSLEAEFSYVDKFYNAELIYSTLPEHSHKIFAPPTYIQSRRDPHVLSNRIFYGFPNFFEGVNLSFYIGLVTHKTQTIKHIIKRHEYCPLDALYDRTELDRKDWKFPWYDLETKSLAIPPHMMYNK